MNSRTGFHLVAAVAAAALVVVAGGAAQAGPDKVDTSKETVIRGGVTQSLDPTAYNYLAPGVSPGGMVEPMSALGVGYISVFKYSWNGLTIPVPSGYLIHQINGSGLSIPSEWAVYSPSTGVGGIWGVNICNWRIDFQNRSSSNNGIILTRVGATHAGCSLTGVSRTLSNFTVKQGKECARLYVNGTYRGEQCHAVF
jgi:hypothetical protein